jgi:predicted kinase
LKGLALPRLRVFAGPNGSGKSTIRDLLREEWIGVYVNADEIEKVLRRDRMTTGPGTVGGGIIKAVCNRS